MILPDFTAVCDGCGADVGNGGVTDAATAQDCDLEQGLVLTYHFGRRCGCAAKVLSPANLAHRLQAGQVGEATVSQEE